MTEQTFALIPLAQLHESALNPRRHYNAEALQELAFSVKTHGVLTPLLVRPNAKGYEIGAGHRRYRAAKLAGLDACPAVVREMSDATFLELLNIENLLREDVHPLEEAQGYQTLMKAGGYTVERLAERVGKSIKYVYDRVKLLALTKPAQQLFWDGAITAGHAVLLARLTPSEQARVIGAKNGMLKGDEGGLFQVEDLLWDPSEDDSRLSKPALKPVSVRELQAWIDQHVKFHPAAADPMLFPETVGVVSAAKEQAERVVAITHEYQVAPDARDGQRVLGTRSWKRADGSAKGAAACEHAIIGVIVIGPRRGEAFKVCVDKERCDKHWGAEKRARAKRGAEPAGKNESRWEAESRKRQQEQQRREAEIARWAKARPEILTALAAAVKKAPARADGLLGTIVVDALKGFRKVDVSPYVPRGKTPEDLVRHAAFLVLHRELLDDWRGPAAFPKRAKALGIDVLKIVDRVAPRTPAQTSADPKKARAKT